MPDQNRSSNSSAAARACRSSRRLRPIIAHETIDAMTSNASTSCTTMLACSTSCNREWLPIIVTLSSRTDRAWRIAPWRASTAWRAAAELLDDGEHEAPIHRVEALWVDVQQ